MDPDQYTTLAAALQAVPDPRQRYPWALLLTLIMAALVSGEQHGRGIGQWGQEHAAELGERIGWPPGLPSEATLRRVLRDVDLAALEDRVMRLCPATEGPQPGGWQGQALDGKALRGARVHGRPLHLLGLVSHQGRVLGQRGGRAQQRAHDGSRLADRPHVVGDRHHPGCRTDSAAPSPADPGARGPLSDGGQGQSTEAAAAEWQRVPVSGLARGTARVKALGGADGGEGARLAGDPDPGSQRPAGQAAELARGAPGPAPDLAAGRTADREADGDGALCGDQPAAGSGECGRAGAALAGPLGEREPGALRAGCDLGRRWGQASRGNTPQALAILRNALLNVLRSQGWQRIADALRHYGAAVERALLLIDALPAGL